MTIAQPATPVTPGLVRLLDPTTINQIAAGEVVERPGSVVKELVENALDAGSTRIRIELEDSGRTRISVRDNGIGMSAEDAVRSLERHATSKIRSVEDLSSVQSLGFRGEAIPSIASVSRFTLSTADQDGLRTVLRVVGGEAQPPAAEPGSQGTDVTVEDLFFNTPARLKFLKSDTTELSQCFEHVARYAIARPDVAFHMLHNGQVAIESTGSGNRAEAVASVWGREMARALSELDSQVGGVHVRGFVSPPHLTKPTRAYQFLFVNGRPVRSRSLMAALDQAYRDLTPEKRFPVVALLMEIDPGTIDVNVSPTKTEVKFQREGAVFDAVRVAVKSALMQTGMIPSADQIAAANEALRAAADPFESTWNRPTVADFRAGSTWADPEPPLVQAPMPVSGAEPSPVQDVGILVSGCRPFASLLEGLRIVGQVMNTFIVCETKSGMAIVDQHVAHERVLYEYLCGLKGPSAIETQPLLLPQTLHLDRRTALLLRDRLNEIRAVGFDIESFGGDPQGGESYVIRAAPAALRKQDPVRVLRRLAEELVETTVVRRLTPTREQIWITSACHMAVKAGDPLSMAEMEKLIVDLAQTENPYLCPHGRPITASLSVDALLRLFKR
jgi:DNA mismatch repair protein MutL